MASMHLTITQRLNLGFLLGEQRGNVGHVRACSAIMDKIELSAEERAAAGVKSISNGIVQWQDNGEVVKSIDLTESERALVKSVVEAGPLRPADLAWANPLLGAL